MKVLLIHSAEPEVLKQVRKWEKNKHGMGEYYHLSIVDLENQLESKDTIRYITKQIEKAVELYNTEETIWLCRSLKPMSTLPAELSNNIKFIQL